VLRVAAPGGAQGVDLVDEDSAGCIEASHLEKEPHQLLALAPILGGQGRGGHVEEGGAALGGHRLGQHRFARSRRTHHQNSTPRPADSLKELWHNDREHNRFLLGQK